MSYLCNFRVTITSYRSLEIVYVNLYSGGTSFANKLMFNLGSYLTTVAIRSFNVITNLSLSIAGSTRSALALKCVSL